jgi:oxygen-dependent protoporphyrinogen oxidase
MARNTDVVIVGAGLAGLTAAHLLTDLDVTVLEAEPRVGGRATRYRDYKGLRIAVGGAMWFDSNPDSPEARLLEKVGAAPELVHASGTPALLWGREHIQYTPDVKELSSRLPFSRDAKEDYVRSWRRVRAASDGLKERSKADNLYRELMSLTAAQWLGDVHPEVREFFSRLMQAEMHVLLEETSAFFFVFSLPPFGGGNSEWGENLIRVPGGGKGTTAGEALAASLQITPVTDALVTTIYDEGSRCLVRYRRNGEDHELSASKVIVTTPSSTVARLVRELPAWKLSALLALRPSCVVGLHLLGDKSAKLPWSDISFAWAIDKSFSMLLRPADDGTVARLAAVGAAAMFYADRTDAAVVDTFQRDLYEVFPNGRAVVEDCYVHRFFHPATMPRFGVERHADELMRPIGNIHFAGDYTGFPDSKRTGEYDGDWGQTSCIGLHAAIRSGIRVAKEVQGLNLKKNK